MKTPTIAKPTETTSFEQVIAKADAELLRLAGHEKQIALQLQANEAELETLAIQATAHETEKDIAQQTLSARRTAMREAETYAALTEGTMSKKPDLKALEKLLKQAQSEQMVILDRVGKAEQAEERRRHMLEEACEQYQRDLAQLAERKDAMQATKERVFAEQGETEYNQQSSTLASLQDALVAKEQEVQQAQAAIDEMGRKALLSLENWPELQDRLSHALPYHDTTTMLLEAAMSLLDILLTSGHDVERFDTYLLNKANIRFGSIENLLSCEERALHPVLYDTGTQPVALEQKKIDLSRLLEVYVEHKKEKAARG